MVYYLLNLQNRTQKSKYLISQHNFVKFFLFDVYNLKRIGQSPYFQMIKGLVLD